MTDRTRGYTLVEIVIVCAIIGILASLAIHSFLKAREDARINVARSDLRVLSGAVHQLGFDTAKWPGGMPVGNRSNPEVWDLTGGDAGILQSDGRFPHWNGPYVKHVPLDPWGNKYFFDNDYLVSGASRAVVGSFGPNGAGRNQYDSDDIYVTVD